MSHSFREEPELTYEQAKQALYRALELQSERESLLESSDGVNREQLAQMAAELGVKPEYVRQATDELLRSSEKPLAWNFDPKNGFDQWVDRPVQEDDWVELGRRLQPILHNLGSWDVNRQSAGWVGPHVLKLSVTAVGQRSRVKLVIDPSLEIGLGIGLGVFALFLIFVIAGSISDHDVASIVGTSVAFLIYVVVAGYFKLRANRGRKRMVQQLSGVLAEYFSEPRTEI